MSLLSRPPVIPAKRWLEYKTAAVLLGVDERTIKRWMKNETTREALGAVRRGKQWRIPAPESEWAWEVKVRTRLEQIGVRLKSDFQKEFENLQKDCERNELEAYRLWLAARIQLAARLKKESRAITRKEVKQTWFLFETACEVLKPLSRGADVNELKPQFPARLKARGLSRQKIRSIMSHWPEESHFGEVRAAFTLEVLEAVRRRLDRLEAEQTCKHLGREPTQMNAAPYLHKDLMAHITDIPQPLPKGVQAFSLDGSDDRTVLRYLAQVVSKRISLRTAKRRYPQRKLQQKKTVAEVHDIPDKPPDVDEKPFTGKTPIHDSSFSNEHPDNEPD